MFREHAKSNKKNIDHFVFMYISTETDSIWSAREHLMKRIQRTGMFAVSRYLFPFPFLNSENEFSHRVCLNQRQRTRGGWRFCQVKCVCDRRLIRTRKYFNATNRFAKTFPPVNMWNENHLHQLDFFVVCCCCSLHKTLHVFRITGVVVRFYFILSLFHLYFSIMLLYVCVCSLSICVVYIVVIP